jgi:hypothetical protein
MTEKTSKSLKLGRKKIKDEQSRARVRAEMLATKLSPDPAKLLSPDGEIVLSDPTCDESLRDPFAEKADLLKTEWAFYGGELEPEIWLETVKGYDRRQSKKIMEFEGYSAWKDKRLKFQNQALENFAMRSVDTLVEFQDYIGKGAKLTLVRAMEMLQTPVKKIDPSTGKWTAGLTSMDIKNIGETLDKAQTTMMRALGIHPKEEIGVKIVYEQLKTIQLNQMKDATAGSKTYDEEGKEIASSSPTDDPRLSTLTNEEMWAMIEILREQKKKESVNEN